MIRNHNNAMKIKFTELMCVTGMTIVYGNDIRPKICPFSLHKT